MTIALGNTIADAVRNTDKFISDFTALNSSDAEIDYIHGEKELISLVKENCAGILLPPMDKKDLFSLVKTGGSLPRKTFSMGEAAEKRYYIEARVIK
jgi:uncharacterized protein (DUF1015 family)